MNSLNSRIQVVFRTRSYKFRQERYYVLTRVVAIGSSHLIRSFKMI